MKHMCERCCHHGVCITQHSSTARAKRISVQSQLGCGHGVCTRPNSYQSTAAVLLAPGMSIPAGRQGQGQGKQPCPLQKKTKPRSGWEEMLPGELYKKDRNLPHFVSLHIASNLNTPKCLGSCFLSELQKSMESSHLEWQAKKYAPANQFSCGRSV